MFLDLMSFLKDLIGFLKDVIDFTKALICFLKVSSGFLNGFFNDSIDFLRKKHVNEDLIAFPHHVSLRMW